MPEVLHTEAVGIKKNEKKNKSTKLNLEPVPRVEYLSVLLTKELNVYSMYAIFSICSFFIPNVFKPSKLFYVIMFPTTKILIYFLYFQ